MSDFVQHNSTICSFNTNSSWVVLSPTEMSIKKKVESIGTPLKEWNIQIYRGILTGFNEAFIISADTREMILSNCSTEEERIRTDEVIRPVLRGRDIDKYSYNWASLYLISTFPSRHYKINDYPALRDYLLSFDKRVLAQSGEKDIDGIMGKNARKKTCNEWFETQDSIGYWDEFSKPKIIYPNMTKYMPFVFDDKGYMTNQKCFIITGENISYLTLFLNSSLFKYCFRDSFPELLGGTRELSKVFFDKIPVKKVQDSKCIIDMLDDIQQGFTKEKALIIDNFIFDLYELTDEERKVIGYIEIR